MKPIWKPAYDALLEKHGGPGPHKDGSSQKVHGGERGQYAPVDDILPSRRSSNFTPVADALADNLKQREAAYARARNESRSTYWPGQAAHRAEIESKTQMLNALRSGDDASIAKAWRNVGIRTRMDSLFGSVRAQLDALSGVKSEWPDPEIVVTW